MPEIDVTETFLNFSLVINKSMFLATFLLILPYKQKFISKMTLKYFSLMMMLMKTFSNNFVIDNHLIFTSHCEKQVLFLYLDLYLKSA